MHGFWRWQRCWVFLNETVGIEVSMATNKILSFYQDHIANIKPSTNWWYTGLCRFHEDTKPSFSFESETGNWRCHASCGHGTLKQFCDKAGIPYPINGNGKRESETASNRKIVTLYDYTDENGVLLFQTVRYEPKDFRQRRPDGKGGFVYNLQGVRFVPFNLTEVLKSDTVFIVEGEKDCQSLAAWGLTHHEPNGSGEVEARV